MPRDNDDLSNEELPKLGGFPYNPKDKVFVIDIEHPKRNPFETTYSNWLLLSTNFAILGISQTLITLGNQVPDPNNTVS